MNTITPPKMTSSTSYVLILVIALALSQCVVGKFHVHVQNQLGEGTTLVLHCQSKDDDLGVHLLGFYEEFQWSFDVNIWGNTLFYCDFVFGNVQGHYNIFVSDRDAHDARCDGGCFWGVRPDGLYFLQNQVMTTLSEEVLGLIIGLEIASKVWNTNVDSFAQES
ncbi:hypothetical protein HHK36_020411 [Tetracentron sinense]|uniref:S-protein homolog n=1 Tax=Tetracentron sinense TaxID=13715 RepID=A0A835DBL3_TETSI|nr:hypothetical protein HHK36_020411 [Tetracentron sinense]